MLDEVPSSYKLQEHACKSNRLLLDKKKITTQQIARVNSLPQSKKRLKSIFANLRKLHFSFKRKNFSMKRCWYIGMINSLDMKIKLFPIN